MVLNWDQTWQKFVREKKKATRKPRAFVGKRVQRPLPKAKQRADDRASSFSFFWQFECRGKRHVYRLIGRRNL